MGHTPGPWAANGSDIMCDANYCVAGAHRARTDDDGNWMPSGEVDANASLIAAAPDLLHACQAVANDLQSLYDIDGNDFSGMTDDDLFGAFLNVLDRAIAKAEGRSE